MGTVSCHIHGLDTSSELASGLSRWYGPCGFISFAARRGDRIGINRVDLVFFPVFVLFCLLFCLLLWPDPSPSRWFVLFCSSTLRETKFQRGSTQCLVDLNCIFWPKIGFTYKQSMAFLAGEIRFSTEILICMHLGARTSTSSLSNSEHPVLILPSSTCNPLKRRRNCPKRGSVP